MLHAHPAQQANWQRTQKHRRSFRDSQRASPYASPAQRTRPLSRAGSTSSSASSRSAPPSPQVRPADAVPSGSDGIAPPPALAPAASEPAPPADVPEAHLVVAALLHRIAHANDTLLAKARGVLNTAAAAAHHVPAPTPALAGCPSPPASPIAPAHGGVDATTYAQASRLVAAGARFASPRGTVPGVSLSEYAQRLKQYAPAPGAVWVAALVLVDRVANPAAAPAAGDRQSDAASVPPVVVCSANAHRLLLAALAVAAKSHSDVFYSNRHYAKVGGIPTLELTRWEAHLLDLAGWRTGVTRDEYARYAARLGVYATATGVTVQPPTQLQTEVGVPAIHVSPAPAPAHVSTARREPERDAGYLHAHHAPPALATPPVSPAAAAGGHAPATAVAA